MFFGNTQCNSAADDRCRGIPAVSHSHNWAHRTGTAVTEDRTAWWAAVEDAPELAELVRLRAGGFEHTVHDRVVVGIR